jgi:hypothetical protein
LKSFGGAAGMLAVLVVAMVLSGSSVAAATDATAGFDISYPQCNGPFPSGGAFAVVGVNGGRVYSPNPCLGTGDGPSELSWAGMDAGLYANTADPGPALSTHWPNGQTSPYQCNTATNPGPDTPQCHYDYGWNAAADSYADAVNAYVSLGWTPAGSTRTPVANAWWLDVETANSWTATTSLNVDSLQGESDYLSSVGAASVGFYSSSSNWQTITGGTTLFAADPSWVPGAGTLADAQSRCGTVGPSGGQVLLSQYLAGGFDGDYRCRPLQPSLGFATATQTLMAGTPSNAMSLQLSQPSGNPVMITMTSSSTAGMFSTSSTGPWNTTLTLTVPSGSTSTESFFYEDTKAGSPTLTGGATGYPNATQTETVTHAALAAMTVSPTNSRVRVGTSKSFSAAGTDRYGNSVPVTPTWSVTPALGSFSPNPGNPTGFSATTVGTGSITAEVASVAASTSVSVVKKRR